MSPHHESTCKTTRVDRSMASSPFVCRYRYRNEHRDNLHHRNESHLHNERDRVIEVKSGPGSGGTATNVTGVAAAAGGAAVLRTCHSGARSSAAAATGDRGARSTAAAGAGSGACGWR